MLSFKLKTNLDHLCESDYCPKCFYEDGQVSILQSDYEETHPDNLGYLEQSNVYCSTCGWSGEDNEEQVQVAVSEKQIKLYGVSL